MRPVVIIGQRTFARRMWAYLTRDAGREVAAFAVHRAYMEGDDLLGVPVVAIEDLPERCPPGEHDACVAAGFLRLNRARAELCDEIEQAGYPLLTYVASTATCWDPATIGRRNVLVLDRTVVGPFATVGENVVLNGCNVNHDATVEDHCFIATGATVGGESVIGAYSFVGLNATVRNGVRVAPRTVIGAGALVKRDTAEGDVLSASASVPLSIKSWDLRDPF